MKMKTSLIAVAIELVAFALEAGSAMAENWPNRWFYMGRPLTSDQDIADVSNVVQIAKAGGMNGMVFVGGLEFASCWPRDRFRRLREIRRICDAAGVEIIPSMYSFGYGSMINYGSWRLEGEPVNDIPYVVRGGRAVWAGGERRDLGVANPQVLKAMNRLIRMVSVKSASRYRLSCQIRTDGVKATRKVELWARDAAPGAPFGPLGRRSFKFSPTQGWTTCEMDFNVGEDVDKLYLYAGYQGGYESGTVAFRDFTLERVAPSIVMHGRPGTPVSLRDASTGAVYVEGRDYICPKCVRPRGHEPMPPAEFELPAGSAIREGTKLVLDCYSPAVVDENQVSTCISDPSLYELVSNSVALVEKILSPAKWHLSMDEFRNGGTCASCRAKNMTMAQIYGEAVTKVFNTIRGVHPGAEVHIWSDMLDPNHNGMERYYNCRGSFKDAWRCVPKELVVDCWYGSRCEKSLKFFSEHGFRTLAAAYYDEKPPLKGSQRWRDAGRNTPGFTGYMYTTWRNDYSNLAEFCRVMSEPWEDRWVFLPCNFWKRGVDNPNSLEHFTNIAARAKASGYNAVVMSAHLDLAYRWPVHLSNQVTRAKAFCDGIGIDIVPMMWDVGYAGNCPGNWMESRTIEDLPYVRRGGRAVFDGEQVEIRGGPVDRIEAAGSKKRSMAMRIGRRFTLRKGVRYVITARVKSTGVPADDKFQFIGFIPSRPGKSAYYHCEKLPSDGEWHDVVYPLEARTDEEIAMMFGHWGPVGRLEIENFRVTARGVCGATRRERIPFIVKDAATGRVYEEGRDYAEVPPIAIRGEGDPMGPYLELTIPEGSSMPADARLLVTCDIPNMFGTPHGEQYAACMSNPDWYRRAEQGAAAVQQLLHPRKWFLCFDELRSANTCAACRSRKLDMAHLIGDCLQRQREIVRKVNPEAKCYVWGDMLDPNHNAHEGYAHTVGSYTNIAQCIPKDLVICPWWGKKAAVQADYWVASGFRMTAGAYYDDKTFKCSRSWLEAAAKHPGAFKGFMFCTWRNDFSELENFAKLMFVSP